MKRCVSGRSCICEHVSWCVLWESKFTVFDLFWTHVGLWMSSFTTSDPEMARRRQAPSPEDHYVGQTGSHCERNGGCRVLVSRSVFSVLRPEAHVWIERPNAHWMQYAVFCVCRPVRGWRAQWLCHCLLCVRLWGLSGACVCEIHANMTSSFSCLYILSMESVSWLVNMGWKKLSFMIVVRIGTATCGSSAWKETDCPRNGLLSSVFRCMLPPGTRSTFLRMSAFRTELSCVDNCELRIQCRIFGSIVRKKKKITTQCIWEMSEFLSIFSSWQRASWVFEKSMYSALMLWSISCTRKETNSTWLEYMM